MKKFVTMLLVVSMLAAAAVSVSADGTFTGSVEAKPVVETVVMGADAAGNTYIAKGTDAEGNDVVIAGDTTVTISAAYADVAELAEEDAAVVLAAQEALAVSQQELADNAKDLSAVIPELSAKKEYAVSRLEAVVAFGADAAAVEKIVEAKAEMTVGLSKDFGYSKANGDKIAIKFADGSWKVIPAKQIHFREDGSITLSFVPESASYQIALIKEVKTEAQIKAEKKAKRAAILSGYRAARSNRRAGWAVRVGM